MLTKFALRGLFGGSTIFNQMTMAMNNDDDSHTTLNHQGGDDDSCASSVDLLAPSPQKENNAANTTTAASPAPSISPSTQTLNVLSQHDAVGGGNLQYDIRNLNQDASAVTAAASQQQQEDSQEMTASQQVQVSAQNDFQGWNLFTIALTEPGSLGMTVRRLPLDDPSKSYTIVHKVHPNSQADRAGVLPGDVVAATYEEVTKWPQGPRPIAFSVIRKPAGALNKRTRNTSPASSSFTTRGAVSNTTTTTTQTKTPTANNKSSTATTTAPAAACKIVTNECAFDDKTTTSQDAQAAIILAHKLASTFVPSNSKDATNNTSTTIQQERKSPSPATLPMKKSSSLELANNIPSSKSSSLRLLLTIPTTTVVPFCRACRNPGATGRAHHALCPQHPQFDNSGAKEKLQLIRRGVEMNCPACLHHYQYGRVASTTVPHVAKCPRRKQPLRQHGQVVLGMVDPVLAPPVHTNYWWWTRKSSSQQE